MKGAGKGVTRVVAIKKGASEEIMRGTHLTAVYPALFFLVSFTLDFIVFGKMGQASKQKKRLGIQTEEKKIKSLIHKRRIGRDHQIKSI